MFKHIPILSVFVFWTSIFYSRITIESYKCTWYHMISSLFGPSFPQVWRWLQHQYPLHRASANGLRSMSQRLGRDLRPTMSGRALGLWEMDPVGCWVLHFHIQHYSTIHFGLICVTSFHPNFTQTHFLWGAYWRVMMFEMRWTTRFCIFTIARLFAENQSISFTNILHLQISVCVYKCT